VDAAKKLKQSARTRMSEEFEGLTVEQVNLARSKFRKYDIDGNGKK
jgi:hypothetical protein